MERIFLYKNFMKVAQRLPEHYKYRYKKQFNTKVKSPHFQYEEEAWKRIPGTDKIFPMTYFNIPPKVIYPAENDKALFSGEGIVTGLRKKTEKQIYKVPKTWRPAIFEELLHSEILDRWMLIVITLRTSTNIELCGGFDEYIIKTPDAELQSRLGLHLKREMLMKLAEPETLFPNDHKKRDELLQKHKEYIISKEEASWIGYNLQEAVYRQMKIEDESIDRTPYKIKYMMELSKTVKDNSLKS